jgi:hypothetical protein
MAVEDLTHLLDKEEGSAFDPYNALFGAFDGGGIFNYDNSSFINDMRAMLVGDAPDSKAQTLESVLTLPIRSAPFYINQGRARSEVYDVINRIITQPANNGGMTTPMNLVVAQMCNAFVYKKSFFEKVWTRDEYRGKGFTYAKIAWRPPGTCAIERDPNTGAFRGFRQMPIRMDDTEERKFEPKKAFVYIHGTHRDPLEGVSDLHVTHWCYLTKQKIRFLWYQFLEGQALPKTVVRNDDPNNAQTAARKLIGLRQGGVVGLSKDNEVDTLESSGRGAAEFKAALQWLDSEASSSVLAGFTDLGAMAAGGTGSFALSKDQTDFYLMSREAEKREMQDYINQYLIADLVRWNFGPKEIAPTFEFGPIDEKDASAAISLLQATAQTPVNQSVLPQEFFDQLTQKVAGFLELDVTIVRNGIERARKEAEDAAANSPDPRVAASPAVAGVKAAVDTATNALQQKAIRAVPDIP